MESKKQVNEFVISEEILQAIVSYMQTKPYNEVAGILAELSKSAKPHNMPKQIKEAE